MNFSKPCSLLCTHYLPVRMTPRFMGAARPPTRPSVCRPPGHVRAIVSCVGVLTFPLSEELGAAAFFPGMPETWAAHPLAAAFTDLTPAALHHPTLIQHPALAQVPVRVSFAFPYYCTQASAVGTTIRCWDK